MAITRKTVIDQIEIRRDGTTQVRIGLLLVEGETELATTWHRSVVPPNVGIDAHVAAIEANLQAKGFPAIEAADKARTRAAVTAVRGVR